jgi:hypothetical protein
LDDVLGVSKFPIDPGCGFKRKLGMRIGMIPNLVTLGSNTPGNVRMALNVHPTLEESSFDVVLRKVVEQRQSALARSVIEGYGD